MEPPKIISHVTAALHAQEASESQAMGTTGGASSDPEGWEAPDGSSRGRDCSRAVGSGPEAWEKGGRGEEMAPWGQSARESHSVTSASFRWSKQLKNQRRFKRCRGDWTPLLDGVNGEESVAILIHLNS